MPHALRIGAAIDPNDSYWVQVREAVYARADQLPLDLISISLIDDSQAYHFRRSGMRGLVDWELVD